MPIISGRQELEFSVNYACWHNSYKINSNLIRFKIWQVLGEPFEKISNIVFSEELDVSRTNLLSIA